MEQALQAAKDEECDQVRQPGPADHALPEENQERQREDQADQAAPEAMNPLPPEDLLETCQIHAAVDLLDLDGL